jgi:hypothetical protein
LKVRVFLLAILICFPIVAETAPVPANIIVENYCAASRLQELAVKPASMDVDIDASLPKLKKQGRLHALRRISSLGRITYEMLKFEGDGTIKNQVIARYLSAEAEVQKNQAPSLAVTPENYRFKYKGRDTLDGREVHVFQVSPKKKRQGLFKGEVWIDAATYLRVRESGQMVKNPSFFVKKIAFTRMYEIRDGISVPRQVQSEIDTRLVGKAELTINFSNFSVDSARQATTAESEGQ